MSAALIARISPLRWLPATILPALGAPLGMFLGAIVGWPLGTLMFGNPSPQWSPSPPEAAIIATTIPATGLGGAAAGIGTAATGYTSGWTTSKWLEE